MPSRYDTCIWVRGAPAGDRIIVEELRPRIGSLRILDVGCATGRLLGRLAEAGATQLCGVDLAPRILEVAAQKLQKTETLVDLRTADVEDCLPWADESFDVVTLTGVLHHFFRPKDALTEIRRVLCPGGRLLLMDPCFFWPVRQTINAALHVAPHDGDHHFYSVTDAAALVAQLGFEVCRTGVAGFGAFLVNACKPRSASLEPAAAQQSDAADRRMNNESSRRASVNGGR